jgi:hypothetical protein
MALQELDEKPGGARNVVSWDVHVSRDHHPVYALGQVKVEISVTFDDDESATAFETAVRAMLPEVKRS